MSEAQRIGTEFVELVRAGRDADAVDRLYAPDIVSIEGQGTEEMPARLQGLDAIGGKHQWWFDHHQVHGTKVRGPFIGHRDGQFAVKFDIEVTPVATGQRSRLSEVGVFTVRGGRIVQEEYLYLRG